MKLLLDTHIWIWFALEPERLTAPVLESLESAAARWLSPISVWEAVLLAEKGRIDIGPQPAEWVRSRLRESPMRDAPLDRETAVASRSIELGHDDPADRFLAATAIVQGLTLVTADRRLIGAANVPTMANV